MKERQRRIEGSQMREIQMVMRKRQSLMKWSLLTHQRRFFRMLEMFA
jgi:hypothetical protein